MKRYWGMLWFFVLMTFLLISTAGCGTKDSSDSGTTSEKAAQVVRVGLNSGADTFDPAISTQLTERYIMYATFDTLVQYDKDFNIQPGLAVSWTNPDPKSCVLKLREGVKFQDGTDFNADTVKWNFDRMLDPATKSPCKKLLGPLKTVEVLGPYEVKFTFDSPYPSFLSVLGERPGFMVSPDAVQKAGDIFGQNPVGTGPYKLTEWVKDDHITLTKWDGYWDTSKTFADQIVFKFVPDTTVREQMLRTGDLDIIDDVLPTDIALLEKDANIKVGKYDSMTFIELGMRCDQPPFNNLALRQAISYGIDRQEIIDLVASGNGKPGLGPLPTGWAANPNLQAYSYNPEKAKELLKQAGVPANFSFVMTVSATPIYQKIGELVQQQLSKIGINVQVKPVDYSQHYSMEQSGETYAFIERWTPRADPGTILDMHFSPAGFSNNDRYNNKEVADLISKGNATYDQAERTKLFQQAEQLIVNDAPMVWIYYPSMLVAQRSNVTGYEFIPDGIIRVRDLKVE